MMSFIFRIERMFSVCSRVVFGSASFRTARPCSWKVLVGKFFVSTKKVADNPLFHRGTVRVDSKLECFDKWQEVQRALIWVFAISTRQTFSIF